MVQRNIYILMSGFLLMIFSPSFALSSPQATIGIDFLSKTMYLEDRTVGNLDLHF